MHVHREFVSYLESFDKKLDNNDILGSIGELAIELLEAAQKVHIWHFNCDTMNQHNLLEELYNDMEDWSDRLVESYISITKKKINTSKNTLNIDSFEYRVDILMQVLEKLKNDLQTRCDKLESQEGLISIIGSIIESIDEYIYKFHNLT